MVYFCYSSSLNVCRLYIFVLDSHLAALWESNCPFGFPLVMFPLGLVITCCVSFPLMSLMGGVG